MEKIQKTMKDLDDATKEASKRLYSQNYDNAFRTFGRGSNSGADKPMAKIPLHGFGDNTFEYIPQPDHTAISALMSMVSLICGNGGAVSLGGDPGSTVIEAAIVYKGNTYTGSITKEAIYHDPNKVINSCCEILERVLKAKPQAKVSYRNSAGEEITLEEFNLLTMENRPTYKMFEAAIPLGDV